MNNINTFIPENKETNIDTEDQKLSDFHKILTGLMGFDMVYFPKIINPLIKLKIGYNIIKDTFYIKVDDEWNRINTRDVYIVLYQIIEKKVRGIYEKLRDVETYNPEYRKTINTYLKGLNEMSFKACEQKKLEKYLEANKEYFTVHNVEPIDEKDFKNSDLYERFIKKHIRITKDTDNRIDKQECMNKFIEIYLPFEIFTPPIKRLYNKSLKNKLKFLTKLEQDEISYFIGCSLI